MKIETVRIVPPHGSNVIIGQTHFIKTVEDLYEIMVTSVPGAHFGIAFCEASGPCLIRAEGNHEELRTAAIDAAQKVGAGHTFYVFIKDAFPINILGQIKACMEVCSVFCATANPLEVIVARTEQGGGILGVIDGSSPKGVESDADVENRKSFLRKIGYKR
jgi:adenosine/AMP kinase